MKNWMRTWVLVVVMLLGCATAMCAPPATVASKPAEGAAAVEAKEAKGEPKEDPVHMELNLGEFVISILIFVALLVVLRMTAWKPIMAGLKSRELAIRESIEAAAKAKADAEKSTKELEARIAEAQRQAAQQLNQAKADALKVAETIRGQAEAESTALKERTLREIDAAKQQAVAEINSHAAELGTAVARKILQRNVTAEDQQRLVDESLAQMAKKN